MTDCNRFHYHVEACYQAGRRDALAEAAADAEKAEEESDDD